MRAVILAGGKGTRLRPYTSLIPKPLVPIGGKYSILEIVILQLAKHGFTHITLAVNHLSHLIMAYFGTGDKYGVKIDYSIEEEELGTFGPLTLIDDLPNDFLVMNGDILCDINYRDFLQFHLNHDSPLSISTFTRKVKVDFGVLETNSRSQVIGFIEKPTHEFNVSMGIYCINRKVVEDLVKNQPVGFDEVISRAIASQQPPITRPFKGYWLDIGRHED
jgi:NDP-sugar pyrophosphorylase family protein